MREAVDADRRGSTTDEMLQYGASQRRADHARCGTPTPVASCLERTAAAARDTGSLQVLDLALWIMSLAELNGGTPRRAAQHMEQVRELRRAIGYDAEHVINVAMLAWSGAPRDAGAR